MQNPYTNTGAMGGQRGGGNHNGMGNGQNRSARHNPGQNKKRGKNTVDPGLDQPYVDTDVGNEDINTNHDDYFQTLMGQQVAGYSPGGASPFDKWLQTEGFRMMEDDYGAARLANGGDLNYKDFADNYQPGTGYTPPVDTGNAFTSSSGGSPMGQQPTIPFRGHGAGGRRDKHRTNGSMEDFPMIEQPPMAAPAAAPTAAGAPQWGNYFMSLTPEQRGEYQSGYSMGPSRWSVYG